MSEQPNIYYGSDAKDIPPRDVADQLADYRQRIAELEAALADRTDEGDSLRAANYELRAINVQPGISLGKALEWKQERDELLAHEEQTHQQMGEIVGFHDEFVSLTRALKQERDALAAALDKYETWRKDREQFLDEWLVSRTFDHLPGDSQAQIRAEKNIVIVMHEMLGKVDPFVILAARLASERKAGYEQALAEERRWEAMRDA